MLSFSDMSLVLLCFFVLLLSMSTVDERRYDTMSEGMKAKDERAEKNNLGDLAERLQAQITAANLSQSAEVILDVEGLRIEFKDKLLFKAGSAEPSPQFAQQADKVLAIVATAQEKYEITIEGHTDDAPLNGSKLYVDNWELSAHRAFRILNHLKTKGVDEKRLRVLALAHAKPKIPVKGLKGKSLTQARDLNRRVVVHIR